ncbi:hypothetical protein GUITHDRAFT_162652 [Guillardia theta CCMP2712]|uniref:Uncharacterized protein n=1 Tax=Guillardia theta (strain CCMP2712) TaxID=905079 RepID=L1JGF6_GUITC|nr:hypothetical protein GUITHDRAFT_162652 [Guillardia theta CCMP2712]EKX47581.1 hypothetical protein GUITHDRAFT_162652 [Guillardia theta CCMP2712]|eukprot:XP_005834561.1 hypothetical protein GUITHDRAFT_162652 [Guillardia theta CCMP2712]
MRFAAFTVLVAICAAVPMRKRIDDDDSISAIAPLKASSIPGPSCTLYNNSGGCNDDPCCTWCGTIFNATKPGFCMMITPFPIPTLQCQKAPTTCGQFMSLPDCDEHSDCMWVPEGPISAKTGMCVYNWDSCKTPTSERSTVHKKAKKSHSTAPSPPAPPSPPTPPTPPAPPAPIMCNMTTAEECDATPCCQWCGSIYNTTAPGWCMKVLPVPIPAMKCSKGNMKCTAFKTELACNASASVGASCKWVPFGPPGSIKGICISGCD